MSLTTTAMCSSGYSNAKSSLMTTVNVLFVSPSAKDSVLFVLSKSAACAVVAFTSRRVRTSTVMAPDGRVRLARTTVMVTTTWVRLPPSSNAYCPGLKPR